MVVSLPMPDCAPYICHLFSGFSNVCHSACIWPTALKLGCVTNLDMLFLVLGFISLVDEIQFMLISGRHICIRSISFRVCEGCEPKSCELQSRVASRELRVAIMKPESPIMLCRLFSERSAFRENRKFGTKNKVHHKSVIHLGNPLANFSVVCNPICCITREESEGVKVIATDVFLTGSLKVATSSDKYSLSPPTPV